MANAADAEGGRASGGGEEDLQHRLLSGVGKGGGQRVRVEMRTRGDGRVFGNVATCLTARCELRRAGILQGTFCVPQGSSTYSLGSSDTKT